MWHRISKSRISRFLILALTLTVISAPSAVAVDPTWTKIDQIYRAPFTVNYWQQFAASADMHVQAAAMESGYLYISTNSGSTWTAQYNLGKIGSWNGLTVSEDGTKIRISANSLIYISNDSGGTWSTNNADNGLNPTNLGALAGNGDGSRLFITNNAYTPDSAPNFSIQGSFDSGIPDSWTHSFTSDDIDENWLSVGTNQNGTLLAAVGVNYSTLAASIWIKNLAEPASTFSKVKTIELFDWGNGYRYSATVSQSGEDIFVTTPTKIWSSSDSGGTWLDSTPDLGELLATVATPAPEPPFSMWSWYAIKTVTTESGVIVFAASAYGILTSNDLGSTWSFIWSDPLLLETPTNCCTYSLSNLAVSPDGSKIIAADSNMTGAILNWTKSGANWVAPVVSTVTDSTAPANYYWSSLASDETGTVLVGAYKNSDNHYLEYIYISRNSGDTWESINSAGSQGWTSVAVSPDGSVIAAASNNGEGGQFFLSTDGGATWVNDTPVCDSCTFSSIAFSKDGQHLALTDSSAMYLVSVDTLIAHPGEYIDNTWVDVSNVQDGITNPWSAVAARADGKLIAAVSSQDSNIYLYSTDTAAWTTIDTGDLGETLTPFGAGCLSNGAFYPCQWTDVTMSDDGQIITAIDFYGSIASSTDGGVTWQIHQQPSYVSDGNTWSQHYWSQIKSNADGSVLTAVQACCTEEGSSIYISKDFGLTWDKFLTSFTNNWSVATTNYSGSQIVVANEYQIWKGVYGNTTHTVTYAGGAGSIGTPPTQADVAESSTFTIAANTFSKSGFSFDKWSDGTNEYAVGATYTMGTGAVTLTAVWTANAPTYIPDPVQASSITSISPTNGDVAGGYVLTINGNFPTSVALINVGGAAFPAGTFTQTSQKITLIMPAHVAGPVNIILYNGQAPLMPEQSFIYEDSPTPSASPTPTPTPSASPTPTPTPSASPTPTPTPSASPTPTPKTKQKVVTIGVVSFKIGSTKIPASVLKVLRGYTGTKTIIVTGYAQPTDPKGDYALSLRRAEAVRKILLQINPKLIVKVKAGGTTYNPACAKAKNMCAVIQTQEPK